LEEKLAMPIKRYKPEQIVTMLRQLYERITGRPEVTAKLESFLTQASADAETRVSSPTRHAY
jgi:hypothetical protein